MESRQGGEGQVAAAVAPTRGDPRRPGLVASWRMMRPYLGASNLDLGLLVVLSAFAGFAEAGVLLLVVRAALAVTSGESSVDLVAGPVSISDLGIGPLLAGSGVLLALVFATRFWSSHLIASVSARSLAQSRESIFAAFVGASWEVQSEERAGALQDVMSTNLDRVAAASLSVATSLAAAFQFAALLASGVAIQPVAALVILVSVVALFFAFRPISRMSRRAARATVDAKRDYANAVAETVALAQEIRTFDVGDAVVVEADGPARQVSELHRRSKFLTKLLPSLYQNSVLLVILLGVLVIWTLDIEDVAALGAVVLMLVRALTYSQTVQTSHQAMADLMPYLEEARAEEERYRAAAVKRDGEPLDRVDEIRFDRVTFSYPRASEPALSAVDLTIARGEAIGIAGPSGSGKSTFMQLLLRLRDPDEGVMLVNGRPAGEIAASAWFGKVALVSQDARLFSGSVRDNVRFHRPHLTDADLERAVEQAHVADDIARFEHGWETHVGERGGGAISGGQRQRISIARALAGRPDLLVLDEPTSALDMRSEALIRATLEELKGQVTLVIVAHRMSTLHVCDRLAVFDRGRLTAVGPTDEMLRTDAFLTESTELSKR